MFLTVGNLVHHLIGRGLLSADSVVDGDCVVVEAGRRNRNFKIVRSSGGIFVKQIKTASPDAIVTIQREAIFYQVLQSRKRSDNLTSVIPSLIDYDPATYSLALELLPDAEDLWEYHVRVREFPEAAGEVTGRSLGIFHSETAPLLHDPNVVSVIPPEPPWIFTLNPHTLSPLTAMGAAGNQLGAILRAMPDLLSLVVSLQSQWQYDSLTHGDMKWENCIILTEPDGRLGIRLVDWELAGVGDGLWDAAAIFTSYLVYMIFTTQPGGVPSPDDAPAASRTMLQRMRPALAAFWREYCRARQIHHNLSSYHLLRTVRFCAARLVVAAFEHIFNFGQASAHTFAMLHTARNILLDPLSAANGMAGTEGRI